MRQHVIGSWTEKVAEIIHFLKALLYRVVPVSNAHVIPDWGLESNFETEVTAIGLKTSLSGRQTQVFLH